MRRGSRRAKVPRAGLRAEADPGHLVGPAALADTEEAMNFLIHYFVDGTAFFVGAAMLLAGPLLPLRGKRGGAMVIRIAVLLGAAVVAFSGTPLPLWFYGVWAACLVAWLWTQPKDVPRVVKPSPGAGSNPADAPRPNAHGQSRRLPRGAFAAIRLGAAGLAAAAIVWEGLWQIMPAVPLGPSQTLYVIGDSISAGLEPNRAGAWPEILARRTGARVVNLAQAGAKVGGAAFQAGGIEEANAFVLIEIGANDLFNTPAAAFEADLDALLRLVAGPERRLVMVELPSLPWGNSYLAAQRRLAGRYGVAMIPRRILVHVWATPGATLDDVHFSPAGHEQAAKAMAGLMSLHELP